eukprot:3485473-Amphidinium_carterae.1
MLGRGFQSLFGVWCLWAAVVCIHSGVVGALNETLASRLDGNNLGELKEQCCQDSSEAMVAAFKQGQACLIGTLL